MKVFIIFFILLLVYNPQITAQRRCSGTSYCGACTSCSSCKNCNDYGGSCGVCGGGDDVKKYKPRKVKIKRKVDNSYSPANEYTYSMATDTVISTYSQSYGKSYYEEEKSGNGTSILLSVIAIILFIRWLNKQSK